jgi:hypothetical protein
LASSQFTFTAGSHSHPVHIHSQLASRPPSAAPAPTVVAPVASAPAASPSSTPRSALSSSAWPCTPSHLPCH